MPTNGGTTTKTYTIGTVKDQYGVNWYQDASWDTATVSNGVTFSNGTLTVPADSNRANDYTVTLKEKCGSATNTKTVTIKTFDYIVVFKNYDGTTLRTENNINYSGSATAPTHPNNKPADATYHYDANGWDGTYTNLTTGAQTKTVTAKYTSVAHTPSGWKTDANQHWKQCTVCNYFTTAKANHSYGAWSADTATCTAGGSHSRTCSVCSYVQTESTSQLGHSYTAATVKDAARKSAATCTAAAVYYYSCFRCGAVERNDNHTFTNGAVNPANHTNLTHTAAVGATCRAAGNIEYWYCSGCRKYFSNAAGTAEITQAQTIDPQKDHSYTGTVRDNKDGTHSFLCVNGCNAYGGTVACTYSAWDKKDEHTARCACSVCHHGKEAAVTADDTFILEYQACQLDVLANDGTKDVVTLTGNDFGAATKVNTNDKYTLGFNGSKVTFKQDAALSASVQFTYTVTFNGKTYSASVKVIPANSIYLEESFISFTDGSAAWQNVAAGSDYADKFVDGLSPNQKSSVVDGFGVAYNAANSSLYSMGTAKYVEVSKEKKGAVASFDFTGKGFDLYAVTAGDTGVALVRVTKPDGTKVKNLIVNSYFGFSYGPLYLTDADVVTLTETSHPIYYLAEGSTGGFFIDGTRRGTTDVKQSNGQQAYGWVPNERGSETTDGGTLYQVPVISCKGLDYGTYHVEVEPRFSASQNMTGGNSYKFYVDSVRIYDPIDPDEISKGGEIYDAYLAAKEYDTHYQEIRDILIDAKTFDAANGTEQAGVAFLETNKGTDGKLVTDVATYKDIGPKNEVYLEPGQAVAFEIETGGNAQPAKLAVGVKTVKGSGAKITVNTTEYDVTCATEMYKDILAAVSWANTTAGSYKTNVVVIRNAPTNSSVISLTKLKWSYGANETQSAAPARMLRFSFSRSALNTLELAQSTGEAGAQTLDSSAVTVTWDKDTFELGETATLTITAPANFEKALLDGKEIAGYEELDNGMRQWTYQVTAEELGAVSADVTLEDANGYRTKALSAPALAAQEPTVDMAEVTAVWENDAITLGETALLTATVPANVVSVTVGGEELTQFTLNEDGTKTFQYTVTPDAADAYQYTLTLAEGHGYTFDAGTTPLLTVEAPVVPETPDEPETPVTPDDPMNPDGPATDPAGESSDTSKGGRWSFYDLLQAIINFIRKVIGMFNINAQ